ncbi:hypothetical protein NL676_034162 [Syzygium grande]|nr:hypothetical protein NL676_034162 [Syzygium grande]
MMCELWGKATSGELIKGTRACRRRTGGSGRGVWVGWGTAVVLTSFIPMPGGLVHWSSIGLLKFTTPLNKCRGIAIRQIRWNVFDCLSGRGFLGSPMGEI